MQFQTIDDLRRAQNALKIKTNLPLPYPLSVQIDESVGSDLFSASCNDFMVNSWTLVDRTGDTKKITNPISGLHLDDCTIQEFRHTSSHFVLQTVALLRYDLKKKYTYGDLQTFLPKEAIFTNESFIQTLAVLLRRGIGHGRSFLRGNFHSNLFLVHSNDKERILAVRVFWSYKKVSDTTLEGWKIETTVARSDTGVRYETSLYTYSSLV